MFTDVHRGSFCAFRRRSAKIALLSQIGQVVFQCNDVAIFQFGLTQANILVTQPRQYAYSRGFGMFVIVAIRENSMRIRFTENALGQLSVPDGRRDQQWFDDSLPGFGLRKFSTGRAAYFVRYQLGKQQRKIALGSYVPGILGQMRKRAADILADVRGGVDVQSQRRQQAAKRDDSLGELIPAYLDARKPELSPDWYSEIHRFLTVYWTAFHHRPIQSLERGELVRELDKIAKARGAVTADHCRKALSALFG